MSHIHFTDLLYVTFPIQDASYYTRHKCDEGYTTYHDGWEAARRCRWTILEH